MLPRSPLIFYKRIHEQTNGEALRGSFPRSPLVHLWCPNERFPKSPVFDDGFNSVQCLKYAIRAAILIACCIRVKYADKGAKNEQTPKMRKSQKQYNHKNFIFWLWKIWNFGKHFVNFLNFQNHISNFSKFGFIILETIILQMKILDVVNLGIRFWSTNVNLHQHQEADLVDFVVYIIRRCGICSNSKFTIQPPLQNHAFL